MSPKPPALSVSHQALWLTRMSMCTYFKHVALTTTRISVADSAELPIPQRADGTTKFYRREVLLELCKNRMVPLSRREKRDVKGYIRQLGPIDETGWHSVFKELSKKLKNFHDLQKIAQANPQSQLGRIHCQ